MVFFSLHPIRWTVAAILGISVGMSFLWDGITIGDINSGVVGILILAGSLLVGYHAIKWGYRIVRGLLS